MPAHPAPLQDSTHWLQVVYGGLIIAVCDMIFAITLWFTWDAAGFVKVFQTIAVGVLGKDSYQGGIPAALLGAALHLFMATTFVAAYTLAGQRMPALLRKPFVYGPLYGVLLYAIMNFVVMPLSRVGASPSFKHLNWIVLSMFAHMVFGVICVVFAGRALGRANHSA